MPNSPTQPGIDARARIYSAIRAYCLANNVPPSMNDLQDELGIPKSVVLYHIRVMVENGTLKKVGKSKYIPYSFNYASY